MFMIIFLTIDSYTESYKVEFVREELSGKKLGKIRLFSSRERAEEVMHEKMLEIKHRHAAGFRVVELCDPE